MKRTLQENLGVDLLGTESKLREGLKEHGEFVYEAGSFEAEGKKVSFLRVTSILEVIQKSVLALQGSKRLIPIPNTPVDFRTFLDRSKYLFFLLVKHLF